MGKDYIILPKFNVKEDDEAFKVLNNFYKGKKSIYQIESRKILLGEEIFIVLLCKYQMEYYKI